jgi:tRNA-(ms[2]io[6]A)-hydroxylase
VLAAASGDAELAGLYETLFASEFGHYRVFLELARKLADAEAVEARWQQLLAAEAQILARQEAGPRIHSGFGE